MLDAVAETAATTVDLFEGIGTPMRGAKHRLRADLPRHYSQDLLNNLFRHPDTRIEHVQNELGVTRQTGALSGYACRSGLCREIPGGFDAVERLAIMTLLLV